MSSFIEDPERRTVPRWRPWRDSASLGELSPATQTREPEPADPTDLDEQRRSWERHRTIPFAGDYLGAAFSLGFADRAKDAARFIEESEEASAPLRELAQRVLHGSMELKNASTTNSLELDRSNRHRRIHRIRHHLIEYPRNALAYMDLAREYVALGFTEHARKPLAIALTLSPHSRFVLRSAARFYLHAGEHDRAHDLLRRTERLKDDPWIVGAEIAVASAADRISQNIGLGRRMIASRRFSSRHISELASAIGTLEWEAGDRGNTRKLFSEALRNPTENTVAQASWISRRSDVLQVQGELRLEETDRAYEARSWKSIYEERWEDSMEEAKSWLADEPFSSRPAIFGSWVPLTSGLAPSLSIEFAERGLEISPENYVLRNNLSVALAVAGDLVRAKREFQKIDRDEIERFDQPTYLATSGLIEFRSGTSEMGRSLYRRAVDAALQTKDYRAVVWALGFWAREESRIDPEPAHALVKEAEGYLQQLSNYQRFMAHHILKKAHPVIL